MSQLNKELLQTIKLEIEKYKTAINLALVMNDLTSQELKVLCEISLAAGEISKIFGKYKVEIFKRGFDSIDKMINANMFGNIHYSISMSYVLNVHEILEESLELFFIEGYVRQESIVELTKFIDMLDSFEKEQSAETTETETFDEKTETDFLSGEKKQTETDEVSKDLEGLNGKFEYLTKDNLEFVNDFLCETDEMIQSAEQQFLLLETNPSNTEAINTVFRNIHSIKGSAGFLSLKDISKLTHSMENLLDKCRNSSFKINDEIINILLKSLDYLKILMKNLQIRIRILFNQENQDEMIEIFPYEILTKLASAVNEAKVKTGKQNKKPRIKPVFINDSENLDAAELEQKISGSGNSPIQDLNSSAVTIQDIKLPVQDFQSDSIRVPIKKIENVAEMIGELMISLSLLKQSDDIKNIHNPDTIVKLNSLELITDALQSNVLKMRMFPIKSVYDKLNRQIRDLIQKSGKKVKFITKGERTEVDKTVIDEIFAPLTHSIRNSMDHGIELPETRVLKGKNEEGVIELNTENRGDNIVIEIIDDGAGLNKDKILEKARKNGIIRETEIPADKQIYDYIFHPGFSTAEKITEISGRGVGMDVVKKTVVNLGGRIEIETEKDKGTKFSIMLPLSASIIDGIITQTGTSKFIFPILKIKHTLTPKLEDIKKIYGETGEFIVFEKLTVPLLNLGKFYNLNNDVRKIENSVVLIVENEAQLYGIVIDEILYRQKIVTKGMSENLKRVCGVKAATVLGDGSVGLILEPEEIIKEFIELKNYNKILKN
ncbi:MAG TPA: chemotaxis protein CheA [bacterium]|nr:chemotaxis protein CheA [bacterium]HPN29322.1 chemotaxis protein CheA [bacterium]